jgi:hypothetical protein
MAKLTRRTLIKQTSVGAIGVAAIGVLAAAPQLASAAPAAKHAVAEQSAAAQSGPMVVHVRNFSTGEIGVMYGEKEVILRDPALVTRLLNAAR